MNVWFDLLIHVFTITTFIAYCSGILKFRYGKLASIGIFVEWTVVIALVSHFFRYIPPIRFIAVVSVMQLIIYQCFKDKLLLQFRANIECTLMSILGEIFATIMHIFLSHKGLDITVYDSPGRAIMSLVTTAMVACIVPIALSIRSKFRFYEIWRVILWQTAICVTQVLMIITAFLCASEKTEELVIWIAIIQIPGIFISLFCTRTILYISSVRVGNTYRALESKRTEMEYDYYRLAIENNAKLSVLRHDMNNTIQTAFALIHSGDEAKGKELLLDFERAFRATAPVVHCDNEIVNIILNVKNDDMRNEGINLKVSVTSPLDSFPTSDIELTRVLTNLLDNAAEACKTLNSGKIVTVSLGLIQGYYVIKVTNSCDPNNTFIPDDPTFSKTTKNDKSLHGFGVRSVYEICKKYNGNFSMYLDGDKVVSVATLPKGQKKDSDEYIIV